MLADIHTQFEVGITICRNNNNLMIFSCLATNLSLKVLFHITKSYSARFLPGCCMKVKSI